MTTDQQIIDALKPILDAAQAIDPDIYNISIIYGPLTPIPFIKFYTSRPRTNQGGEYGIEASLAAVKPFDPLAEKQAEIKRLQDEIANIEKQIAEKQANENNQ
jgi:hypothetical protein